MPATTKSYVLKLQRSLDSKWRYKPKLLEGYIFNRKKEELMTVVENRIKNLRSVGFHKKSHKILSTNKRFSLYKSPALPNMMKRYQTRHVCIIKIITGMRSTAVRTLIAHEFKKVKLRVTEV